MMLPHLREHWRNAQQVAREFQLSATYFEHEGDPRIRLGYGGDKLAGPVNHEVALSWIGAFFPLSTIMTYDSQRIIISLGPTQHSTAITGQSQPTSDRPASSIDP